MNKHTPKPWKPAGPLATHIIDEKGMMVADAPHFREMTPEEGFANRDLIAAAPDLLEALKVTLAELKEFRRILVISVSHGERMGGWLEDVEKMIARIESTIAKAEGKQHSDENS